jgi:hypothetical protein
MNSTDLVNKIAEDSGLTKTPPFTWRLFSRSLSEIAGRV